MGPELSAMKLLRQRGHVMVKVSTLVCGVLIHADSCRTIRLTAGCSLDQQPRIEALLLGKLIAKAMQVHSQLKCIGCLLTKPSNAQGIFKPS